MGAAKKRTRKKAEIEPRGLTPRQACPDSRPAAIEKLASLIERDGGQVAGAYRDPLGELWQIVAVLPIDKVEPTPFQRDVSEAHAKRLSERIGELGRFLDPIIVVRRDDGVYWTPNGNHRLHAMRSLGARSVTVLVVPEPEIAYRILALNT